MAGLRKSFFIKARDFVHAGEASIQVQNILKSLQLEPKFIRRVAVCSYEGEMNVVMHGGDGEISLMLDDTGIVLEVADKGPGIDDIGLALTEGYTTAGEEVQQMGFGAGMGLPNILKNSDFFDIVSQKGKGACLTMCFWIFK